MDPASEKYVGFCLQLSSLTKTEKALGNDLRIHCYPVCEVERQKERQVEKVLLSPPLLFHSNNPPQTMSVFAVASALAGKIIIGFEPGSLDSGPWIRASVRDSDVCTY